MLKRQSLNPLVKLTQPLVHKHSHPFRMTKKHNLNPVSLLLASFPLLVIGFYLCAALYFPTAYVMGTYEDLYGEWAQTYGFLTTCIFSALIAFNKNHPQRWFFVVLASASFYAFMEEISWGQRLIGFDTPAFFHKNSYQDEANLHNLLTGPVDVWTKTALTYCISGGLIAYGVLFPVAFRAGFKPALWLSQWKIVAVPPLSLMLAFAAAAVLELELFNFNEAEVAELLVAWSLAFIAFDSWLRNNHRVKRSLFAYSVLLFTATLAVWGTTTHLLNSPEQRKGIDDRLTNGYEKFAERYERYDYAFGIAEMLQRYDQLEPNNTVVLRKIADNLEQLGKSEQATVFIEKAVAESLRRVEKDPEDIQAYVSLTKSYRKLRDYQSVSVYAKKAYELAKAKQQTEPKNAYWAYWLAKACEQTNRQQEAFEYYRKAHRLEPESSRYDDAYQQMKLIMIDYEN